MKINYGFKEKIKYIFLNNFNLMKFQSNENIFNNCAYCLGVLFK